MGWGILCRCTAVRAALNQSRELQKEARQPWHRVKCAQPPTGKGAALPAQHRAGIQGSPWGPLGLSQQDHGSALLCRWPEPKSAPSLLTLASMSHLLLSESPGPHAFPSITWKASVRGPLATQTLPNKTLGFPISLPQPHQTQLPPASPRRWQAPVSINAWWFMKHSEGGARPYPSSPKMTNREKQWRGEFVSWQKNRGWHFQGRYWKQTLYLWFYFHSFILSFIPTHSLTKCSKGLLHGANVGMDTF